MKEIRLGDDQRLSDREAVRPAMPWTDRPGAGFTTADEPTLPRRPVRDGPFGYRSLNVEGQRHDPTSFLNWMERAIRTRKEWPEFGWGTYRVLGTRNPAVLAHVASWDGSSVLAIHNFADSPARISVRLPAEAAGGRWRHIFGPGEAAVPGIRDGRLSLELPAYGYHWFGRREGPER